MNNEFIKIILKICVGLFLLSLSLETLALSPPVAKSNSNFWPDLITSKEEFDTASRAEILIFLSTFNEMFSAKVTESDLGIKTINSDSLDRWKSSSKTYWLSTFFDAAKSCKSEKELGCDFKGNDFVKLLEYSKKFKSSLPNKYNTWSEMSQEFYRTYLKEQARLAALFPNPTSEILPLANTEIIGDHFKDREFLLTFDDGPTQTNDTAKYSMFLRANRISAIFFTLGDSLETKLNNTSVETLQQIYQGQCLASHGYHHKSHQKWVEWQNSIDKTKNLIQRIVGNKSPIHFRPPYGQTQESLIHYLENQHSHIFLWNIDSQDWQSKISPEEVSVRVTKLMLLWRKGIILFHDVHKKAFTALPNLIQLGKAADVKWIDGSSYQLK